MSEDTVDFSPRAKHRIEIGENTSSGHFMHIAHPQSAFAGPSVAHYSEKQAREIYEKLGEVLDE